MWLLIIGHLHVLITYGPSINTECSTSASKLPDQKWKNSDISLFIQPTKNKEYGLWHVLYSGKELDITPAPA